MQRRRVLQGIMGGAALGFATSGFSQPRYPSRPIHVVVPYPPGGNTDVVAREIMTALGARLGQPIVVENKVGANGIIGTTAVAKAPADGYTLLSTIGAFSINPSLYKNLPYTVEQFSPVGLMGRVHLLLAVGASVPTRTLAELVRYGRSGAKLSYDSSGVGSALHLINARIARVTGMQALHVPYRGISQSIGDIVSGRITFTLNTITSLGPFIRDGRLIPLVVLSGSRAPQLPEVPTIIEAGYPQLESYAWQGLLAPAQTPRAIVGQLSAQLAATLHDPELRERLAAMGTEAIGSTPEAFSAFLAEDMARAADIVRQENITAE